MLFLQHALLFLDDNVDEDKKIIFLIGKVQPQYATYLLLDVLPISSWCFLY